MGYKVFCVTVFFMMQTAFYALRDDDRSFVNVLCGISWGITACWWLYQAITAW